MEREISIDDSPRLVEQLDGLQPGEKVILTQGGTDVGELVLGPRKFDPERAAAAVKRLRALGEEVRMDWTELKEMIDEGRRG